MQTPVTLIIFARILPWNQSNLSDQFEAMHSDAGSSSAEMAQTAANFIGQEIIRW